MQHMESYKRFVQHAIAEVIRARRLRREQRREEAQQVQEREQEKTQQWDGSATEPALLASPEAGGA